MVERPRVLTWTRPIDGVPLWKFALRAAGVGAMLILAYYFGRPGALFFYQGF